MQRQLHKEAHLLVAIYIGVITPTAAGSYEEALCRNIEETYSQSTRKLFIESVLLYWQLIT
jgi:hypothetical protein